ncbi:MAG: hypothetical protein V1896_02235, partial [Candidatus Zambryskibacteria bacterium]
MKNKKYITITFASLLVVFSLGLAYTADPVPADAQLVTQLPSITIPAVGDVTIGDTIPMGFQGRNGDKNRMTWNDDINITVNQK